MGKKVSLLTYILILILFVCLIFALLFINVKFNSVNLSSVQTVQASNMLIDGRIDINTADAKTLALLNGIGPETANEIVKYRKKHGPFHRIEDLGDVKGIGNATLKKIRNYITIGG